MVVDFVEQAWRYFFERDASGGISGGPTSEPSAWRGSDLRDDQWVVVLSDDQIDELGEAASRTGDRRLHELTADDAPLPTLEPEVRQWADQVARGLGFVVVRGLPVARWGEELSARVWWLLGQHLGRPGAQNPAGDLLGHVVDLGNDPNDLGTRLYTTTGAIRFHCDAADAVGLLCLTSSPSGGLSRIASSTWVLGELWRTRPDLAERLYAPFEMDTRGDGDDLRHFAVTPACFDGRRTRICFHGDYFRTVSRHPDVGPLDAVSAEALDAFEELAERPDVRLDMAFEPGDVQLISNHTVVHARTGYADVTGHPRHLLRLWLGLDGA